MLIRGRPIRAADEQAGSASHGDWDWLPIVLLAGGVLLVGCARGIRDPIDNLYVLASVGVLLVLTAVLISRVTSDRPSVIWPMVFAVLLVPVAVRGILTSIGYEGVASLSAADIQFLRATQWVGSGLPLGSEDARLSLYPTTFSGLAGLSATTGITVESMLAWSWVLAIPIVIMGTYLFVRELTASPRVGALSCLATAGNPWIVAHLAYDGLNLALLPLWGYAVLRRQRGYPRSSALLLLLLLVMTTSHFFSALFLVLVAFAVGFSNRLIDPSYPRRNRIERAFSAGASAALLPLVAVAAWLTYLASRYVSDSANLVRAFVSALTKAPLDTGSTLTSVLAPWQLTALAAAACAFGLLGVVAGVVWVRRRDPRVGAAIALALFAVPLVAWAIITPLQFAGGTDLREWKIRPLAAAFLLSAPVVGLSLGELARNMPWAMRYAVGAFITLAVLTNSLALWSTYGALGPRVFSATARPASVEDSVITPGEYAALGTYVRAAIPHDLYLIADWHQLTWMVGAGVFAGSPTTRWQLSITPPKCGRSWTVRGNRRG